MRINEAVYSGPDMRAWNVRRAREHLQKIARREVSISKRGLYVLDAMRDGVNFPVSHALEAIGSDSLVAITIDKAHNSLLAGSAMVPDNWSAVVRKGSASDFKAHNVSAIGGRASLPIVKQKQDYTEANVTDELRQTITLDKYGELWSFSMEALLNDEMGALADYSSQEGAAWKRTLNAEIFGANNLQNTGNIYDGSALFAAGHNNALATGVNSLNAANLKRAIALMLAQTGINGEQLYLDPKILIVGPKLKIDAQELLQAATYQLATAGAPGLSTSSGVYEPNGAAVVVSTNGSNSGRVGDLNLVGRYITSLVVDPAITGTQWYIQADPGLAPWIQMNFLNGQTEAEIIAEPMATGGAFERDAQRYKIRGAMAAEVVDFRPIVRGSDT